MTTSDKVIVAIGLVIANFVVVESYGQFAVLDSGTSYTNADIREGKTDHLSAKQMVLVSSGSMLPLYKIGEYVTIDSSVPFESIQIGDVIAFKPDKDVNCDIGLMCDFVMHRVIEVQEFEDGSRQLITKGDANDNVIEGVEDDINHDEYIGKAMETESIDRN
jgi:signal peptidase I